MNKKILIVGLAVVVSSALSCSEQHHTPPGDISVVEGAPTWPQAASTNTHMSPSPITSLIDDNGTLIVGTEAGVFQLGPSGLSAMDVYIEEGSPISTGAIKAMARRSDGIMVAADNGLFHTSQERLLYSPLSPLVSNFDIAALSLSGSGQDEQLWLAATQGLYVADPTRFDLVTFEGVSAKPVAVASSDDLVVVSYGDKVYELQIASWTFTEAPPMGTVHAVTHVNDTFYLASDTGLVRRNANGSYTRFTLSNSGDVPVSALGGNTTAGVLAVTAGGVASVSGSNPVGLTPLSESGSGAVIASDAYGNAWVASGTTLTGHLVGTTVSFANTVAPILKTNCNTCHTDGVSAPVHDYGDYETAKSLADAIIQRVSVGQMPPPPTPALSESDYNTLVSWYATGMNP